MHRHEQIALLLEDLREQLQQHSVHLDEMDEMIRQIVMSIGEVQHQAENEDLEQDLHRTLRELIFS